MNRQIVQLDGVRALAVLAVMLFHDFKSSWGYMGVDVFFVLSGMLITGVLLGERERRGRIDLRRFWERRLLRLYPALIALLVLTSPLGSHLSQDGSWGLWWGAVAVSATYTANLAILADGSQWLGALGPIWSLAVEMQFYLVWPVLLAWLVARPVDRRLLLGGTALAAAAGLSLFWALGTRPDGDLAVASSYFRPDARGGELLTGCALAIALSLRPGPPSARADRMLGLLGIAGLGALVASRWILHAHGTVAPMPVAAVGTALVLARLVTSDRAVLSRLLRLPPLPFVGRISYAMYLWQLPILTLVADLHASTAATEILFWGGTLLVGWLSTRFVEQPFLRLKDRLRRADVSAGLGPSAAPVAVGPGGGGAADQPPRLRDGSAA